MQSVFFQLLKIVTYCSQITHSFLFLGSKGILATIFKTGKNVISDESSKYTDRKLVKCLMKKDFS